MISTEEIIYVHIALNVVRQWVNDAGKILNKIVSN